MTFGSREKGARAEREVAALLATWWRQIEPGCEFVKTPLSGGWSSAKVRGDLRASGDVMTTAASFPFAVEVKRRESFAWSTVMRGAKSPVWSWWEQASKAAVEQRGVPMLWLRRSREPWRVMLPEGYASALVASGALARRFAVPIPPVALVPAMALLGVAPGAVLAAVGAPGPA
jgi:hypothetical protein